MDTIKELLDPVKARLNNSIIGSFIISWCIVNWKFLYELIVSNLPSSERITLAESQLNHYYAWILPTIATIFYIFLLPRIENYISSINKSIVLEREKSLVDLEISVVKEKTRLARESAKLELAKSEASTLEDLNERVSILTSDLNSKNEDVNRLKKFLKSEAENVVKLSDKYPNLEAELHDLRNNKNIDLSPIKKVDGPLEQLNNLLTNKNISERDDFVLRMIHSLEGDDIEAFVPILVNFLSKEGKKKFSDSVDWKNER